MKTEAQRAVVTFWQAVGLCLRAGGGPVLMGVWGEEGESCLSAEITACALRSGARCGLCTQAQVMQCKAEPCVVSFPVTTSGLFLVGGGPGCRRVLWGRPSLQGQQPPSVNHLFGSCALCLLGMSLPPGHTAGKSVPAFPQVASTELWIFL